MTLVYANSALFMGGCGRSDSHKLLPTLGANIVGLDTPGMTLETAQKMFVLQAIRGCKTPGGGS